LKLNIQQKDKIGEIWYDPAKIVSRLVRPGLGRKDFSFAYIRKMDGTISEANNRI
jgi:hypothetical protein